MPSSNATKAEMTRALKAWESFGLRVGGMEVTKDGTVRILAPVDNQTPSNHDAPELESWDD